MGWEDTSEKLALFLGAGASIFAGYKTFHSFTDLLLIEKLREEEGLSPLNSATHDLLKSISQVLKFHGKPLTHDNFMWMLDGYNGLLRSLRIDTGLKSRFVSKTVQTSEFAVFDEIVKNAIDEIIATTVQHYSKNYVEKARTSNPTIYRQMKQVYDFYIRLAFLNSKEKPFLRVFTTNYDLLIEDLFSTFAGSQLSSLTGDMLGDEDSNKYLVQLYLKINAHFDKEEMKRLCFQLNIDYDDLPAETKTNKAMELVKKFWRLNRMMDLIKYLKSQRPNISWDDVFVDKMLTTPEIGQELAVNDFRLVNGFCDIPMGENMCWDSGQYTTQSPMKALYLYRIHGCVSWYWHEFGDNCVYFHRNEPYKGDMNRVCAMFPGHEIHPGIDPHALGFRKLYETLGSCQAVIFIGFSFRDDNVMHLLLAANAHRKSPLKIMAVDPNLRKGTIIGKLVEAAKRSPFPVQILTEDQICVLPLSFGEQGFGSRILDAVDKQLLKGG